MPLFLDAPGTRFQQNALHTGHWRTKAQDRLTSAAFVQEPFERLAPKTYLVQQRFELLLSPASFFLPLEFQDTLIPLYHTCE